MIRILFILTLVILPFFGFGQGINGTIYREAFGGKRGIDCIINAEVPFSKGDVLKLYQIDSCKNSFIILFENRIISVEKKFFNNADSLNKMILRDSAKLNEYFNITRAIIEKHELENELKALENGIAEIKKITAKVEARGISVVDFKVNDESDVTEGTGLEFSIMNSTKKTIKYIFMTVIGYNAVDDPVIDNLRGSKMSIKCVGPLEQQKIGRYGFEYVWFTDLVEYAKIVSLKIQFMDGSIKIIPNPNSARLTKAEATLFID